MLFKGTTEIEVNGVKIGLKFGMLATAFFCEEEKVTLKEMTDRLQDPTPFTLINSFYCAAKSYAVSKKQEFTYTQDDAADWMDEIGLEQASKIIFNLMEVYQDKDEKKVQT